jgi:hypothetical protein
LVLAFTIDRHDKVPDALSISQNRWWRFGLKPWWVGLDVGCYTAPICHGVEQRGINVVMGYRRASHKDGSFYKREYTYGGSSMWALVGA